VRDFTYWLRGDRAGRVVVGSWRWLWGLPVEAVGKVADAVAEESLQSMQESVQQLAKAVAMQVGAYERAKTRYQEKREELKTYEQQARLAQRSPARRMGLAWR
jgi:phage shock protein A